VDRILPGMQGDAPAISGGADLFAEAEMTVGYDRPRK